MASSAALTPEERKSVSSAWWLLLVDGILAIILGVLAMVFTSATVTTILVIFGIISILVGAVSLYVGLKNRDSDNGWGWLTFQGLASLVIGLVVLRFPDQTAAVLGLIIAFWALAIGIIRVVGAMDLRKRKSKGWGWELAAGLAMLVLGLIFLVSPGLGTATVIFLLGLLALIAGIALVVGAFMVRKDVKDLTDDGVLNQSNA